MPVLARTIPAIFSVEVGSANLGLFLLQRLVFLGLGGALLCFSIFYVERLTGESERKNILRLAGTGLLVIAVFAGVSYEGYFVKGGMYDRSEYFIFHGNFELFLGFILLRAR